MQKEVSKDMSVSHDVSLDNQPNSYKNINIRNGQLIVFTSTLYMDAFLSVSILGLFIAQLILQATYSLDFMLAGIILVCRSYLKFPFAIAVISHQLQLRQFQL